MEVCGATGCTGLVVLLGSMLEVDCSRKGMTLLERSDASERRDPGACDV